MGEYILSLVIEVLSQAKHKRLQVGVVRATDCDNSSYKSRNASYQHQKLGKPFLISALDCSQLVNGLPNPNIFSFLPEKHQMLPLGPETDDETDGISFVK